MPHEYFRYAVAGATLLAAVVAVVGAYEGERLGDAFGNPAVVAGGIAASIILGWWLYNAFRFFWAYLGDFEPTRAMGRIRRRLVQVIDPPTSPYSDSASSQYTIDLAKVLHNPEALSRTLKDTPISVSRQEFITLFDPYQIFSRLPCWLPFCYRRKRSEGLDWLFVEHLSHLYFFRDASGEYTRGFASSFQGYLVAAIAAPYGALTGGLAVSLLLNHPTRWTWVLLAAFVITSLVLLISSCLYGYYICRKENEARLMLTSILMVPEP